MSAPCPDYDPGGTCDWGACNGLSEGWRWDEESKRWLPVCWRHSLGFFLAGLGAPAGGAS